METTKKDAKKEVSVYKIAHDTFRDFMALGHDFKYSEISEEVIRRGGINRYSFGMTLNERLAELEEQKKLLYIPKEDIFVVSFNAGHFLARGIILSCLMERENFSVNDLMENILIYVRTDPRTFKPQLVAYLRELSSKRPWLSFSELTEECSCSLKR